MPLGEAAALLGAAAAASVGDYKSLSLLACTRSVLKAAVNESARAPPESAVSRTVLLTAAQKYADSGARAQWLLHERLRPR